MTTQDLILNIAVNLGRLSRWAANGNTARLDQFIAETDDYMSKLKVSERSAIFEPTFQMFSERFESLKQSKNRDDAWVEEALTWANILQHRAKLA